VFIQISWGRRGEKRVNEKRKNNNFIDNCKSLLLEEPFVDLGLL
jgi:hypothetical protein